MLEDKRILETLKLIGNYFKENNIPVILSDFPNKTSTDIDLFIVHKNKDYIKHLIHCQEVFPVLGTFIFSLTESKNIVPFDLNSAKSLFNYNAIEYFYKNSKIFTDNVYLPDDNIIVAKKLFKDLHSRDRYRVETLDYIHKYIQENDKYEAVKNIIEDISLLINKNSVP